VHQQTDANVNKGLVINTEPGSGSSIAKGGTVTVNVSLGAGTILLPNVGGEQYNAAYEQLKALGFTNINPVSDNQSPLPSGEVDRMTPAASGKYAPSQLITLYVSGGGVAVPNVSNGTESYQEAEQILSGDGFVPVLSAIPATGQTVAPGVVYNQNPPANTVKPRGSKVQIFYEPLNSTPTPTPSATTGSPTATATSPSPTTSATATGTPPSTATPTPGT
jgi:eukaryotic-like serine/threonine-protein kinase